MIWCSVKVDVCGNMSGLSGEFWKMHNTCSEPPTPLIIQNSVLVVFIKESLLFRSESKVSRACVGQDSKGQSSDNEFRGQIGERADNGVR